MDSSERKLYSGLLLGALIVGVVMIAFTLGCFKPAWPVEPSHPRIPGTPIPELRVVITSPKNGRDDLPTSQHVPIEGTYSGDLTGRELWVLAYSYNDGMYYPQAINDPQYPGDCEKKLSVQLSPGGASEGRWITHFYDAIVEKLDLVVVATKTNSAADQFFKDWVLKACIGQFPGGIPAHDLPGPLTEKAAISVKTK
jgi:hypothetical protein